MAALVDLRCITKDYGGLRALDDVSLSIGAGRDRSAGTQWRWQDDI